MLLVAWGPGDPEQDCFSDSVTGNSRLATAGLAAGDGTDWPDGTGEPTGLMGGMTEGRRAAANKPSGVGSTS